jgi:hypothetical protein
MGYIWFVKYQPYIDLEPLWAVLLFLIKAIVIFQIGKLSQMGYRKWVSPYLKCRVFFLRSNQELVVGISEPTADLGKKAEAAKQPLQETHVPTQQQDPKKTK